MARMSSRTGLLWGASVLAVGLAVGVGVRAGNVTPPPGPVQGTMHTLDEIYALNAAALCQTNRWNYKYRAGSGIVQVATGQGVLHGVMLNPCSGCPYVNLYDSDTVNGLAGKEIAAPLRPNQLNEGARFVSLDVVFSHGLVLEMQGPDAPITVIYKLDAVP